MNFNRIKHFSNNQDIRYLSTHPEFLFKFYAQNCTYDEWLQIYKYNQSLAKWMNQWLPNRILSKGEINLVQWNVKDVNLLNYFIEMENTITVLSIEGIMLCDYMEQLCRLINLVELNINLNTYGCDVFDLQFPHLSKLSITTDDPAYYIVPEVSVCSRCFEEVVIRRCGIDVPSIVWMLEVDVNIFKFIENVACTEDINELISNIFSKVRELKFYESYGYDVGPFHCIKSNDVINFESNSIEKLRFNIKGKFDQNQCINQLSNLKKVIVELMVYDFHTYLNLFKCLMLLKNNNSVVIFYVNIHNIIFYDPLFRNVNRNNFYQKIRYEILSFIKFNSNVLIFVEK